MVWFLWVCIGSAAGICVTERHFPVGTYTQCANALSTSRVEPASGAPIASERANGVEVSYNRSVVMLCVPLHQAGATPPPAQVTK